MAKKRKTTKKIKKEDKKIKIPKKEIKEETKGFLSRILIILANSLKNKNAKRKNKSQIKKRK
jgi:hypothetical protein